MDNILIIDDDVELCELLGDYLAPEGFCAVFSHDGAEGASRAIQDSFSLVILDIMLPTLGGLAVLDVIRKKTQVPVLMLTAKGNEIDRIVGLEMGADDYLAKPFNPRELIARIRAILRRTRTTDNPPDIQPAPHIIAVGDIQLDRGSRIVRCTDEILTLTAAEFSMLEMLMLHAGTVVSKDDLSTSVLGHPLSPYDRSVDVHISRLRKKLGPAPEIGERIITIRSSGYLYALPPEK